MKLIELIGTHYEVGYAYGSLLGISQIIKVNRSWITTYFS